LLYCTVQLILRLLFLLLTRRRVKGRDNIPKQGPVIFVSNHIELVDSPLLWVSLGRRAYFMAKEEVFRSRIIAYFMSSFGAFPVRKGRQDRKALLKARQLLADGQALIIYPEGMRSQSRRLKLAFPGAALIASRSGAPVIPIGIYGTEKIRGIAWLWRRPEITVNIGVAFTLPPIDGRLTKIELSKLTNVIMGRIAEMLPMEYRGDCRDRSLNVVEG
jgi:1-acyl-sn-glycerol-3-phosphate acyltransferase